MWSGDVGNDWKTLRYQISAGLGLVSTGLPWWTFDAGGFAHGLEDFGHIVVIGIAVADKQNIHGKSSENISLILLYQRMAAITRVLPKFFRNS